MQQQGLGAHAKAGDLFSMGEDCFVLSMHPEEDPSRKGCEQIAYRPVSLLCAYTV